MYLVQMLLPLQDNEGHRFLPAAFERVHQELTEKYGGATAFLQAPAEGWWKTDSTVSQDQVVLIEVMAKTFDRSWWTEYRADLLRRFRQRELLLRALAVEVLENEVD